MLLAGRRLCAVSASQRLEAKQELGRRTPQNRVDAKELAS